MVRGKHLNKAAQDRHIKGTFDGLIYDVGFDEAVANMTGKRYVKLRKRSFQRIRGCRLTSRCKHIYIVGRINLSSRFWNANFLHYRHKTADKALFHLLC